MAESVNNLGQLPIGPLRRKKRKKSKAGYLIKSAEALLENDDNYLYHWIDSHLAIKVIKSDTLGTRSNISLTRNNPSYFQFNSREICLVLDKTMLSTKYKIRPYADQSMKVDRDHSTQQDNPGARRGEAEERVTNGPIVTLHKYLVEILIHKKVLDSLKNTVMDSQARIKSISDNPELNKQLSILLQKFSLTKDVKYKNKVDDLQSSWISSTQSVIDDYLLIINHPKLKLM